MPEDHESNFTLEALEVWNAIPADIRPLLLADVYCINCDREVNITAFHARKDGEDLVLIGKCASCNGDLARVIESA